jgi:hypothetical protein
MLSGPQKECGIGGGPTNFLLAVDSPVDVKLHLPLVPELVPAWPTDDGLFHNN